MFSKNPEIKLTRNKGSKRDSNIPHYTISYPGSSENSKNTAHKIISALKSDCEMVMEISSSMLTVPHAERESYAMKFLDMARNMDLDYTYRKMPSNESNPLLTLLLGKKNTSYNHEVLIRVPDEIWNSNDFISSLSVYGAKYYAIDKVPEGKEFLEKLQNMTDDEKLDLAKIIVFDVGCYGTMGIFTNCMTEEEIKEKLGI